MENRRRGPKDHSIDTPFHSGIIPLEIVLRFPLSEGRHDQEILEPHFSFRRGVGFLLDTMNRNKRGELKMVGKRLKEFRTEKR